MLSLGASPPAAAQSAGGDGPTVGFGLRLGGHYATFRDAGQPVGYNLTAAVGAFARIGRLGPFALQPEVLYVQKGTQVTQTNGRVTFEAGYIDVPVLIRAQLPTVLVVRPALVAGPTVGVKITERITSRLSGEGSLDPIGDVPRLFERFDYGVTAGIELGFTDAVAAGLSVSIRHAYGLRDLARAPAAQNAIVGAYPGQGKSSAWMLGVSLRF
jgi:hypothetical protein